MHMLAGYITAFAKSKVAFANTIADFRRKPPKLVCNHFPLDLVQGPFAQPLNVKKKTTDQRTHELH